MSEDAPKPRSGRGGKRPGAGRKKKGLVPGSALTELDKKVALAATPPDEIETVAQRHARSVLHNFVKQLLAGASESLTVRAANNILDRGYGKPGVEIGGDPMLPFLGQAPAKLIPAEIRVEARKYAHLAIEVLHKINDCGLTEAARIAAGESLWLRGLGAAATAKMPDEFGRRTPLGKKEEAAIAADAAATGRYATPEPPGRRVAETIQ